MDIYVVKQGDTVDSIGESYGVSSDTIIFDNQIEEPYRLAVGQSLLINNGSSSQNVSSVYSNGYAYPYISTWVLNQTLPFLSDLSIFSYGFTMEGYLIPPPQADREDLLISSAWAYNTRPILVLTPLDSGGMFNNELITSVVNNDVYKQRLIDQLVDAISQKGYAGLDIDFEYIKATDRDAFTLFVQDVTAAVHTLGYPVSVALAPKTSADQVGLLYQGKDYAALGAAADNVLLMTYEWGFKYGPPMAVAPLNMVRRVVDYAITEIPRYKINLGIPNYGYDWPLPFEKDVTVARTIGNVEAVQIAIRYGAVIQFDETAQSPYFYYYDNDIQHVVWFEDVRSIQAKFNLIKEYDLRGAGYWQIMRWWRANWLLMEDNFTIVNDTSKIM